MLFSFKYCIFVLKYTPKRPNIRLKNSTTVPAFHINNTWLRYYLMKIWNKYLQKYHVNMAEIWYFTFVACVHSIFPLPHSPHFPPTMLQPVTWEVKYCGDSQKKKTYPFPKEGKNFWIKLYWCIEYDRKIMSTVMFQNMGAGVILLGKPMQFLARY